MLHTDELKRLLRYDNNVFYGRGYLKKIDKSQKVAVIDEDCSMPIVLIHCYNYNQKELDDISKCLDKFFYYQLPEYHIGTNKTVLMFMSSALFVKYLNELEED